MRRNASRTQHENRGHESRDTHSELILRIEQILMGGKRRSTSFMLE